MLDNSKIFDSPFELLDAIKNHAINSRFPIENDGLGTLLPSNNSFECVRMDDNSVVLVPPLITSPFLFRGEGEAFTASKPSLFRHDYSDSEVLLERLKLCEFELLLRNHPVVKLFKQINGWDMRISVLGLAQHYGIKTELMDFSSDPNVAMFFATCRYSAETDSYIPASKGTHEGILWLAQCLFMSDPYGKNFFDDNISIIGGQPFARPVAQRGFALRLSKNKSLQETGGCYPYRFKYTAEDSQVFWERFKNGSSLWIKDQITQKACHIASRQVFCTRSFRLLRSRYKKSTRYSSLIEGKLKESNVTISDDETNISYSKQETERLLSEWGSIKIVWRRSLPPRNVGEPAYIGLFKPLTPKVRLEEIVPISFFHYQALMRTIQNP